MRENDNCDYVGKIWNVCSKTCLKLRRVIQNFQTPMNGSITERKLQNCNSEMSEGINDGARFDRQRQSCLHFCRVKGTQVPTTRIASVRASRPSPCSRNQKSKQSTSKSILLINVKTGSGQADVRFPVIKRGESDVTLKPGDGRSQRRKPASPLRAYV